MKQTLFVTGANGYLGRKFVDSALVHPDISVIGLGRGAPIESATPTADFQYIRSDIRDTANYQTALGEVDTVVHLAAATGKVRADEYERSNVDGTGALIDAAKRAGVKRFIYVSTIAAGYANKRYYPYAKTKEAAEELVRASGLDHLILRPTIIIERDSPIAESLKRIATLPFIPLPVAGKRVDVQPIETGDVVRALECVVNKTALSNETLDLGGPSSIPMADFLVKIAAAAHGKESKVVAVPVAPIRLGLSILEPALLKLLPLTAGQLSVFVNDSAAASNWLMEEALKDAAPLNESILRIFAPGPTEPPALGGGLAPPKAPPDEVDEDQRHMLLQEFEVFHRHLAPQTPSVAVAMHYVKALQHHQLSDDRQFSAADRFLLKLARMHPLLTRAADAYAAFFARRSALRRKLILLTALLENAKETSAFYDDANAAGPAGVFLNLIGIGLSAMVALFAGLLLAGPGHLYQKLLGRSG